MEPHLDTAFRTSQAGQAGFVGEDGGSVECVCVLVVCVVVVKGRKLAIAGLASYLIVAGCEVTPLPFPATTSSIVVAPFPRYREDLIDTRAASQYGLLLACSRGVRSLMADYALKQDAIGMYIHQRVY